MRVKKGLTTYKIPAHWQILRATIKKKRSCLEFAMSLVRPGEFDSIRYASSQGATVVPGRGIPMYFTVHQRELRLYPMPDDSYTLTIEYVPPPKVC